MHKCSRATTFILPLVMLVFVATAVTATAQTLPLVRYQSKGGVAAYAAHPEHRKQFQNNSSKWNEYGPVGHCHATQQPGTMPLLNLRRATEFGAEHFYTTDVKEAVAVQNTSAAWSADNFNKGVVCFVATSKLPGTLAVYRYRQPDGQSYIYAFGESENNLLKQNAELKFERVPFHVWAQPASGMKQSDFPDPSPKQSNFPDASPQKPDLSVGNVGVMNERKIIFAVRNNGFAINKRAFDVRLTAYDGRGRAVWTQDKTITPVITKGGSSEHSIEPPEGKTLLGVRIKITVDAGAVIEETDESNNTSDFVDGIAITMPGPIITRPTPEGIRRTPPPRSEPRPSDSFDLKLRPALYFNGGETAKVNTASRYAAPGRALTLKKSEAVSCTGDACTFNLGFFAQRGDAGAELSTYALLRGETFGITGNTVRFAAGETSRGVVHAVKLKTGGNRVVVEIDPEKRAAESDEMNNSFEVMIVVEP